MAKMTGTAKGTSLAVIAVLVGVTLITRAGFEKPTDGCYGDADEACDSRRIKTRKNRILRRAGGRHQGPVNITIGFERSDSNEVPSEALPQCYSNPAADPAKGAWHQSLNGIDDSPANMLGWEDSFSSGELVRTCSNTWDVDHSGEGSMPYFTWEAEECSLAAIDPENFCRIMNGRKGILFVGDSLSHIMTTTLVASLRAKSVQWGSVRLAMMGAEWSACNGSLPIAFKRNDALLTDTEDFPGDLCPTDRKALCSVFADEATLSRFDTLVVNSGAHSRPLETYAPAMNLTSKTLTAIMNRLHGDQAILVARNTVPGHWNCTERMFGGPVELDVALELVSLAPEAHGWSNFQTSNVALKAAFQANHWWYLDAYAATILRPDNHHGGKDCLHYCVPGPMDHWVRLLYNIFLVATGSNALP